MVAGDTPQYSRSMRPLQLPLRVHVGHQLLGKVRPELHHFPGLTTSGHALELVDALVQHDIVRDLLASEVRKLHCADRLALDEALHGAGVDLQRCYDLAVRRQFIA